MRRKLTLALASVLAMISVSALALGLGEIRLNSYLNQRLDAEIELVSATADELAGLTVRLADRDAFERQGIERAAVLSSLNFEVIRRPNGTAYLKVSSKEPIKEPFLTFLVEARWARGRLLREYTLLIDPPVFAERESAPAIEPEAPMAERPGVTELVADQTLLRDAEEPAMPAAEPVTEAAAEEFGEEVSAGEPVAEETFAEEAGDVVSVPPLEAEEQPIRREPARIETPEMGGDYGPIQRNETLWGIAQRLRPDDSITINQMMVAIYRANPEAFYGNINRMKAGYILRIPEYSDVSAISRAEAFREAKRMNEEWRSGTSAPVSREADVEPAEAEQSLSLVAPEEEPAAGLDTGIGAGGEEGLAAEEEPLLLGDDEADAGAVELGVEEQASERLADIEDETLQALQDQEPALPELSPELSVEPELGTEEELPLPVEEDALTGEAESAEPVAGTPDEAPAEEAVQLEQDARTAAPVVQRPAEKSMLDQALELAMSPVGMGAGAALVLLLLVVALIMRKRKGEAEARAVAALGDWSEDDEGDVTVVAGYDDEGTDATVIAGGSAGSDDIGAVFGHGLEHEDTGTQKLEDDAEATQLLADADKTQMLAREEAGSDDFTETVVGSNAVSLDENDPLSEADFHMAYGLYDQAAEVVEKAIQRDPSRKEYKVKLAEIYYAANNNDGFLHAARMLKEQIGGSSDSDWSNIVIMGRQIAPGDALFAEGGATGGGDVDLDFGMEDSGDTGTGTMFGGDAVDKDLDFDLPSAEPKPAPAAMEADDSLDFDLDIGGETGTGAAAVPESSTDMDFDLDLGSVGDETADGENIFGASVSSPQEEEFAVPESGGESTQSEFDKALEELSAYVDTNIPAGDAGDSVSPEEGAGELNLDEFSFDKDTGGLGGDEDFGSAGEEDEESLGEIGTKLDLARAYIDMGDPDGARSILEEVVADGDAEQKKEAQELIDQL